MNELYFSVDIEADGPIPANFSMLSIGVAAYTEDGVLIDTFERNLERLDGAKQDPETMAWWATQPAAWELCQKNKVHPKEAMEEFNSWIKLLCLKNNTKPVFLAYPAGFDFTFVYWYLMHFVGECPFTFASLDIKSYSMAVLSTPFRETTKRNMPNRWKSKRKHTHVALDDALGQGELFFKIKEENDTKVALIKSIEHYTGTISKSNRK